MRNRLWTLAATLALLAVLGKFYAKPLMAQVKAAIVQDRDSKARNIYQAVNNCFNVSNPCQVTFPAVPPGKRLIIEQVSALVTLPTAAGSSLADVELRGASVFQFLPLVAAPGNFGGQVQYTTNQTVLASYDAGQVPEVDTFVASGSTFTVLASISGYMIDIP
ncbi:MAG TPA: hypothetical protein VGF49_11655 [Candidatus Solibacter sp.]|jgi:hypothetical protein